ncbi:NUDIX hydrolase [Clostridium sp. Marseille-P2415]|uniref:NUDIX hydrolase n=1 Tax=Clostridium sp. Marseille-P2415 TaxID=1805471 RepID=UPI00098877AF|nr:CoA pyrophosphatase [Clostridium sp. Marseille-P2415]
MEKEQFSNRRPGIIGEEKFRQYAVLIPMIDSSDITYLLFEKRSDKLRRQPGEICFPGGKLEAGESLQACAVRETIEELRVLRQQIEVTGPGDIYISPFNLMIHPFIGIIKDYQDTFSTDEVDEIIKVPLDFFRNHQPEKFESKLITEPPEDFPYEWIPGGIKYPWAKGTYDILFYQYENWIIWGMTAQIVKSAVNLIDQYHLK